MIKNCIIIISLLISTIAYSQGDDEYVFGDNSKESKSKSNKTGGGGFDWNRVTIGGGLFAQFGNHVYFGISPTFGYFLTDNLVAGIGLSYIYEDYNDPYYVSYTANTYSGSVFTQYIFETLPIILHTELEVATIGISYQDQFFQDENLDFVNVYVGGGVKQRMGGNSYLYVMALYNLNETKEINYIQPNPIIRIGVAIGL